MNFHELILPLPHPCRKVVLFSKKKKIILFPSILEYNLHVSWRYYLKITVLGSGFNFKDYYNDITYNAIFYEVPHLPLRQDKTR